LFDNDTSLLAISLLQYLKYRKECRVFPITELRKILFQDHLRYAILAHFRYLLDVKLTCLFCLQNTAWTTFLHHRVPRFGNSNNVLDLAQGTQEEQNEYVRGLISSAVALSVMLFLWMLALFYFKLRGPSIFGWLSGRRVALPSEPTPDGLTDGNEDLALMEEELITLSIIKRSRQKLGLSLGKTRQGAIVVYKVDEKSLFFDSDLQLGQRIAAVNDTKCTDNLMETINLIQDCQGAFTIQVYHEIHYEDLEVVEWDAVYDKAQRQQRILRHIVFTALLIIIVMGIVLCANG
jgi:hypothetical protein